MDGGKFSVFDRSVLVSNGVVHDKVMFTIYTRTHLLFQGPILGITILEAFQITARNILL